MSRFARSALALVIATGMAACGDSPTAPKSNATPQDLDVVAYSIFPDAFGTVSGMEAPFATGGQIRFGWDRNDAPKWRQGEGFGMGPGGGMPGLGTGANGGAAIPLLGVLLREAYDQYAAEYGEEEAMALFSQLRELHQEAVEARRAGDREAFLEKAQIAHQEAASIVIEVLGPDVAGEVLTLAEGAVADLQELIDSGTVPEVQLARLQQVLERAEALLALAQTSTDPVDVLAYASRALQVATVGGGQRAASWHGGSRGPRHGG